MLVAVALVALVGMGALVVDVGYFFYARSVVQASANASALAGAQEIGTGGAPLATATTYSSVAGEKNAVSNLTITMVSGYPKLTCASAWATNSGVACSGNYTNVLMRVPAMHSGGKPDYRVSDDERPDLFWADFRDYLDTGFSECDGERRRLGADAVQRGGDPRHDCVDGRHRNRSGLR